MVDSRGTAVALGEKIAEGGEGAVHRVHGAPAIVAKIYHQPPSSDRVAKLRAMVSNGSPDLLKLACWPTEVLSDRSGGTVKGFLMPSAGGNKEVHKLYSPKSRSTEFQSVDWGFLIGAAANIARAFAVVHRGGHVIGDVNHSSVMIAPDATVKLIDCDSFQIQANGRRHLCEVAEPLHTPPELQGKPIRGVPRTQNHDCFGLAVLIFELLFMGRHPFAGMYLGSGDLALEQKIERFMFAYGPKAQSRQMRQPPNTLALEAVSPEIATMFEIAFTEPGANGVRPPAIDWVKALTKLQSSLKRCASDPSHTFLAGQSACPWCEIEAKTGVTLFNVVFAPTAPGTGFDMALVWESIRKVPVPSDAPAPRSDRLPQLPPAPMYVEAGQRRRRTRAVSLTSFLIAAALSAAAPSVFLYGLAGFLIVWVACFVQGKRATRELRVGAMATVNDAAVRFDALQKQWVATTSATPFHDLLRELQEKKSKYEGLPAYRQAELAKLRSTIRERQLAAYLDGHKIRPGRISGIGEGRCITLASFGIETAADVTYQAVIAVPGFGEGMTGRLVAWRRSVEAGFHFDPSKGIDPNDLRRLESEILTAQRQLESDLRTGGARLAQIAARIENAKASLSEPVEQAMKALAQAQANLRAL